MLDRLPSHLQKKYGAAVVGLTLDENGIPALAEQRFALAQKSWPRPKPQASRGKTYISTALLLRPAPSRKRCGRL